MDNLTQKQLLEYARDLKATYDELTAKNKELEALNRKKSDFLDMVAHELRTPVTKISQLAEFLAEEKLGKSEKEEFLTMFKNAINRLDSIMAEIILANQQNKYEVSYKLEDIGLSDLVEQVKREMMQFLNVRGQELKIAFDDTSLTVKGDMPRLRDALFNIVQNASKFSQDNKEICVNLKKKNNSAVIEVIDQGIGIAKDKLNVIFNMFYEEQDIRAHHSGSFEFKSGRLGMGLYIARNIIEKHAGRITVESELGKGSKFSIILPLVKGGE